VRRLRWEVDKPSLISRLFRPIRVGSLLGIPIRVSPAVFVLLLLLVWNFSQHTDAGATGQLLVLLLTLGVSLLTHELAHALVGRRLGLTVFDITIWPLGGMARMDGLRDNPHLEAPVAAAGPIANLLLALGCWLIPGNFADSAAAINLVLGLGNLLPAFPLDGGRILRAWLSRYAPAPAATRAAVTISNWLLWVMLLVGAWIGSFWIVALLCAFLYWAGRMELMETVLRHGTMPVMEPSEVLSKAFKGDADGTKIEE